jgi:peptidoglycan/xylan/chitin deacetylase (PgdA/CDA1 family)
VSSRRRNTRGNRQQPKAIAARSQSTAGLQAYMKASQDAAQKAEQDRARRIAEQQNAAALSSSSSSQATNDQSNEQAHHPQEKSSQKSQSSQQQNSRPSVQPQSSDETDEPDQVESLSHFSDDAAQEQEQQEQQEQQEEEQDRQAAQGSAQQADHARSEQHSDRQSSDNEPKEQTENETSVRSPRSARSSSTPRTSRSVAGSFGSNDYYAEVDTTSLGQKYAWRALAFVLVIVLVVIGAWFWANHVRHIDVKVSGRTYTTRVNTDVASFVKEHHYFGVASGNLLAVDGSVIRAHGGSAPQVLYNGNPLSARQSPTTHLQDGDTLTITAGGDITEAHTVTRTPIAPGLTFTPGGVVQFVKTQGKDGYSEKLVGKTSHRVVDLGVVKKPVDTHIDSLSLRPQGNGKYVALTFDDGPSPKFTEQYLKILKDHKAHATFFNIGSQAKTNADLEKKIIREGHELGSHTWDHPDLVRIQSDTKKVKSEVLNAENQVARNVGKPAPNAMIRMPYGSYSKKVWETIHTFTSSAILWDIDTRDWAHPGADQIVSNVMSHVHNGSVILMHDGGGDRSEDVQALPQILSQLESQGYKCVTMTKLMELDGRFPKAVVEQRVMR